MHLICQFITSFYLPLASTKLSVYNTSNQKKKGANKSKNCLHYGIFRNILGVILENWFAKDKVIKGSARQKCTTVSNWEMSVTF